MFDVSCKKKRDACLMTHCENERPGRKLINVGCYPPKPLSLASLVNLGTRFLFRGVVLSHPEIFKFQDVIKIKNK